MKTGAGAESRRGSANRPARPLLLHVQRLSLSANRMKTPYGTPSEAASELQSVDKAQSKIR
jgi:hypothetical protein